MRENSAYLRKGNYMKNLLYEQSKAVANMNRIEGFDPLSLARTISREGQEDQLYLDVKYRKLWFRLCNPNGKIVKKVLAMKENMAIVEARVYLERNDPEESYIASALSQKFRTEDPQFGDKFLETAETAATGRALSDAGYGIQFADVGEENDLSQVDAGIPLPESRQREPQQEIPQYSQDGYSMAYEEPAPVQMQPPFGQTYQSGYVGQMLPQTAYQQMAPQPMTQAPPAAADNATKPDSIQLDWKQPVEVLLSQLTYEQAKAVKIGGKGANADKTMGQIALQNPADLEWYRSKYKGPSNLVRAAAQILLEKAAA